MPPCPVGKLRQNKLYFYHFMWCRLRVFSTSWTSTFIFYVPPNNWRKLFRSPGNTNRIPITWILTESRNDQDRVIIRGHQSYRGFNLPGFELLRIRITTVQIIRGSNYQGWTEHINSYHHFRLHGVVGMGTVYKW